MNKYRVVDLFCGAGGLSLGFAKAGFEIVFSTDNDPESLQTYAHNLGNHVRPLDLTQGTPKSIAAGIRKEAGIIDVLIGGPPCQGFSVQRRGEVDDPRNHLLLRHVQIGIALSAKVILIENVPTIFGSRGKVQLSEALQSLEAAGYTIYSKILQAADYGVPQLRRRAFVVAFEEGCKECFEFMPAIFEPTRHKTVRHAFHGIPSLPADHTPHDSLANHQRRKISDLNLERLSYVPEGGGRLDIPLHLRLPCHSKEDGHRHLDVYGRMAWDKPAPTITAMFDNFTRGRFGHPSENRNITNREGARLQSFPDSFVFLGTQKSVARQIGNAVPPKLAEAVARSILAHLGDRSISSKNIIKEDTSIIECV
jgi:DNA (cytosine-5)-methyltransferase 1